MSPDPLRPVIIAQCPGPRSDPSRPMRGDSGSDRLARLLGFGLGKLEDQDAMAQALDLRNLIPKWPGPRRGVGDAWPVEEAKSAARMLLPQLRGRKVILLGRRVADAFGLQTAKVYAVTPLQPALGAMLIHHPAGSSRVWSVKGEEARAADAMRSFLVAVPPGAIPVDTMAPLPPGRIPTTAPAIAMVLDDAQLLALKRSGASCEVIADRFHVSRQAVYSRLQRILRDYHAQNLADTNDLRALEAIRLEHLELKVADAVNKGTLDLKAVDRALRISERRSRLLGLDAPARHELSGPGGGPIPTGGPDLTKLSVEELEQLDGLLARADAADHSG